MSDLDSEQKLFHDGEWRMSQPVICKKCGRTFSQVYSRAIACGGCPSSALGDCGYIKCPYCGYEFRPGGSPRVPSLI